MRWNDLETIYGMPRKIFGHSIGVGNPLCRHHMKRRAGAQRHKDHGVAQISGQGGNGGETSGPRQVQLLENALYVIQ
jgi:hypothetical protein